jgi:hypothetical protein
MLFHAAGRAAETDQQQPFRQGPLRGQLPVTPRCWRGESGASRCLSGCADKLPGTGGKIELVAMPVSDVDRSRALYVDQVGFSPDHDYRVSEVLWFVQLTSAGSSCFIAMGTGITKMPAGSQKGCRPSLPTSRRRGES